jgi:hypothetical protein
MQTIKHPILGELQDRIQSCSFYARQGDSAICVELMDEALELVQEAIAQIQGAREDAHRMAARVALDTELLDMLAPEGDIEPPTAEEIMQGHTPLRDAYGRLWMLDKNGACCVATDIVDAWHEGGHDATYRRIAAEIHEACDRMLAEEKEGN